MCAIDAVDEHRKAADAAFNYSFNDYSPVWRSTPLPDNKFHRDCVLNTHRFTTLLTRFEFRQGINHAQSLAVKAFINGAQHFRVSDIAIFIDDKVNVNGSLNTGIFCDGRVLCIL